MILLKDLRSLYLNLNKTILKTTLITYFSSSQTRKQFSDKMSQGRYYEVLGFPKGTDYSALTDIDIKRRYLAMIKKFHSDSVLDTAQKIDNQEISKCIITAFQLINQQRIRQQIDKGIYSQIYSDQDQVAQKIYGKNFNDIKYELFKPQNKQKKAKFMEELKKVRKQSKYYDHVKNKYQGNSSIFSGFSHRYPGPQKSSIKYSKNLERQTIKKVAPFIGVVGVIIYFIFSKMEQQKKARAQERKKEKMTLSDEQKKSIEKKSIQAYEKKLNDLINSFTNQQPPSLKYPTDSDPQQIDQLIEYTIGPDINLYEVSSSLLSNQENLNRLKRLKTENELKNEFGPEFSPFPLTKIKVNSAITLSLQAQRCLQNIYIKVKQVAEQIEQTGKYTPPRVFFRFYGYIMFQLRQKPLSVVNYRDTEYISLFDLFFDYYSPIPLKRHEFNQYLVGFYDEDLKMYGQVHLNHRKTPERYITKNDKIVVMRDTITMEEYKYQQIWNNFYQKYMRIWRRGYSDRISTYYQNYQ